MATKTEKRVGKRKKGDKVVVVSKNSSGQRIRTTTEYLDDPKAKKSEAKEKVKNRRKARRQTK